MIDSKSTTIIFHTVSKNDGMLIQVSKRFIDDLLECFDDRLEKLTRFSNTREEQEDRITSYRDQLMKQVTRLT